MTLGGRNRDNAGEEGSGWGEREKGEGGGEKARAGVSESKRHILHFRRFFAFC